MEFQIFGTISTFWGLETSYFHEILSSSLIDRKNPDMGRGDSMRDRKAFVIDTNCLLRAMPSYLKETGGCSVCRETGQLKTYSDERGRTASATLLDEIAREETCTRA
jgi:hypothetical protein